MDSFFGYESDHVFGFLLLDKFSSDFECALSLVLGQRHLDLTRSVVPSYHNISCVLGFLLVGVQELD